jgi:hypothetical protein
MKIANIIDLFVSLCQSSEQVVSKPLHWIHLNICVILITNISMLNLILYIFFLVDVCYSYCQIEGTRIVHPVERLWRFYGIREDGFRKTSCHQWTYYQSLGASSLFSGHYRRGLHLFWSARNPNFIRAMNTTTWEQNLNMCDKIRRFKQTGVFQMDGWSL